MAIAKHSFDICNGTLTISKVFEKNAAIPGSEEQKKMIEYMKLCGDRLIISYYKPHAATKGLRFAQMENHILHTRDAAARLKQFETVKQLSKSQKNPYKYVLDWFNINYPNFTEQPEFDDEGYVKVEAAAHSTAENTAEAPAANAKTSLSSNEEEAPAVVEEAA